VVRYARRLGRNWQLQRRGLFKPALQIKYGELLLLFSLPSNVPFNPVLYEVMKSVIYVYDEENVLLCGKQQIDAKKLHWGFLMCTLHILLG
jgi:hypothetical protein